MVTLDAKKQVLGKLATEAANLLRGKNKPNFKPNSLENGEEVLVINSDKLKVTGDKMKKKIYYRHTGYPGGLKEKRLEEIMEEDSRKVIWQAIYGMLPKNKLRDKAIKRLKIYKGEKA